MRRFAATLIAMSITAAFIPRRHCGRRSTSPHGRTGTHRCRTRIRQVKRVSIDAVRTETGDGRGEIGTGDKVVVAMSVLRNGCEGLGELRLSGSVAMPLGLTPRRGSSGGSGPS